MDLGSPGGLQERRTPRLYRLAARILVLLLCLLAAAACAHPNRVSRRALQRLVDGHAPLVLVFGSVATPKGVLTHPSIRFVHQGNRPAPEHLLWSLQITSGDRFYAVLPSPPGLPALDEFYAEVGSPDTGFDKIVYVRLHPGKVPLAMYIGEIGVSPAKIRTAQGQATRSEIRDDFPSAERELKRLYPGFRGTIAKAPLLRDPVPRSAPAERVR